jgi:hypothetical protein
MFAKRKFICSHETSKKKNVIAPLGKKLQAWLAIILADS